jgi:DNA-binding NarL/FixJ family response regulator
MPDASGEVLLYCKVGEKVGKMHVLVADDQEKVRSALRLLLEQNPLMGVVDEVDDAESLLAQVRVTPPDMLLLDWGLPGRAAVELLLALRMICPDIYVIALSSRPDMGQAALAAGVNAFVSKTDPPDRLLTVIDDYTHQGG